MVEAGARAFVNFEDSGLGLAEISHRSPTATKILADTRQALRNFLDIPDNYEVLFMHGGGTGEFSAVVFNMVAVWVEKRRRLAEKEFAGDEEKILQKVKEDIFNGRLRLDYIVTGSWSLKASQEAAKLLEPLAQGSEGKDFINIVTDARASNGGKFGTIPPEDTWNLTSGQGRESAFVYYCDNEARLSYPTVPPVCGPWKTSDNMLTGVTLQTVDGVEFPSLPKSLSPHEGEEEKLVVADMSSNFLSRQVDVSKYAVIFGGAQKNVGITDVTLVIVRKDILTTIPPPSFLHAVGIWSPPVVLSWPVIAKNNSLYNTMPIFSIWIAGEVIRLLLSTHGASKVAGQEALSNAKAELIYRILDKYPGLYQVVPSKTVRSRMNVCFRVRDADTEKEFLSGAEARMLQGLKGHRSVGGIRASNYNVRVPPQKDT